MKIKKLRLKNFQCFKDEEIYLSDMTTFIGANSSGKTAILEALLRLFGRTRSERQIRRSDFHLGKDEKLENFEEQRLEIEAVITFPEIKDGDSNESENTIPVFFDEMVVNGENEDLYVRILFRATWRKGVTIEGEIDEDLFFVQVPEGEEIKEENLYKMHNHQRSVIQVIYVPATREPSNHLKFVSSSILGRMLKSIKWSDEQKIDIQEQTKIISGMLCDQDGISIIQNAIQESWNSYHQDIRFKKAKLNFSSSEIEDILNKMEISFLPTFEEKSYNIEKLGDGLRSLFYLTLVHTLLDIEQKVKEQSEYAEIFELEVPLLRILAVEEPENHVSPHVLGKIISNLKAISDQKNAQILLTSHSPNVVKRIAPKDIKYLRMCAEELSSSCTKIYLPEKIDEAYKYVKEAVRAYPELYFARLVVLGEGDSEEIILNRVLELIDDNNNLDSYGISIVPLGGRHVNHFWKLLNQLEIPYITLLDLDLERNQGGWTRIKYIINQLLENGYSKRELIPEQISDDEFLDMNNWPLSTEKDLEELMIWVRRLEDYDIYFSEPLDVDFVMLKAFKDKYIDMIPENGGPIIPDDRSKYEERITNDIKSVLKSNNAESKLYSSEDKELMIWYKYFFLTRGKPSTHIMALSNLENEQLKDNLPEPFNKIIDKIKYRLSGDPYSSISGDE